MNEPQGNEPHPNLPRVPGTEKRALITGISGQDGSYLAELLLEKGYEVHGIVRRSSSFNTDRIDHLYHDPHEQGVRLFTHYGDLADATALVKLLYELQPDEVYHLGAQSHVRVSFDIPEYTFDVTGAGTVRLLEAIREAGVSPRFYQASSSEMFGAAPPPQNEETPFHPRSPYGVAKVAAYWATVNYREAYEMFAVNGILFNHESPRRGETFVTRKITRAVARIAAGMQDKLYLGNLEAQRDWGYAPDYVEAMWMMLQADEPDDFVIATGETHTVRRGCRDRLRAPGARSRRASGDRPEVLPALGGRRPARGCVKGEGEAGLAAEGPIPGADRADGRRRRRRALRTSWPAR